MFVFRTRKERCEFFCLKLEDGANKEMKVPIFIGNGKSRKLRLSQSLIGNRHVLKKSGSFFDLLEELKVLGKPIDKKGAL